MEIDLEFTEEKQMLAQMQTIADSMRKIDAVIGDMDLPDDFKVEFFLIQLGLSANLEKAFCKRWYNENSYEN